MDSKASQPELNLHSVGAPLFRLAATLDYVGRCIQLDWTRTDSGQIEATVRIRCTGLNELTWELTQGQQTEKDLSTHHRWAIRARLIRWGKRFPAAETDFSARARLPDQRNKSIVEAIRLPEGFPTLAWLEDQVFCMAHQLRMEFGPLAQTLRAMEAQDPAFGTVLEEVARREEKKLRKREEAQARLRQAQERMRQERLKRKAAKAATLREQEKSAHAASAASGPSAPVRPQRPPPQILFSVDLPVSNFQDTLIPLADLRGYFLRERAAQWWVSNQSDDLLCLPYCRIRRLEYQIRSALRVLGPLRGRALLSDEVGLGKTIEAGLVLKEYLIRGMVKRALILTVPSLVDQWEEELADKFNLPAATTNQAAFRGDPCAFWREQTLIIASLHTLKQAAHLQVAQSV